MSKKDFRFGISGGVNGVDLNGLLVDRPLSTYFMRMAEDVEHLGLAAGDVLIIDRAAKPKRSDIVVVGLQDDAELQIIRFDELQGEAALWGVATYIIRKVKT